MSILSTSSKLVRVSDSYSAGEGISIDNNVISVTGDYGHSYSAGENISISDDNVISSKDWSSDIDTAVQNVSAETTAWVDSQNYLTDADMSDYALVTDLETASGLLKMDLDSVSSLVSSFDSNLNSLSSTVNSNSGTWNDVENKLDISSYHELSAGSNVDIQNYVISSKDWTNEIEQASAYAFSEATALIPTLTFHYVEI